MLYYVNRTRLINFKIIYFVFLFLNIDFTTFAGDARTLLEFACKRRNNIHISCTAVEEVAEQGVIVKSRPRSYR